MTTPATSILRQRLHMSIHALAVIAFYSLLYTAFFSPVIFSDKFLAPGDALIQSLAAFYSPRTLWTTLLAGGFPASADPTVQTWYPVSILCSLLPDSISWNAFVVSAYVLASCFTYGYVYTVTESRFASFISGTIYAMSGFMMARLEYTSMIHAAAWMPLLIWALEKLRHNFSVRWVVIGIFSVTCNTLAGHPQILVYTLGVSTAYVGVLGWFASMGRWRYYGLYLVTVTLGLTLAAIQLLPMAELARLGSRTEITFGMFSSKSLPLYQVVGLLFPYLFGAVSWSFYKVPFMGTYGLTELTGFIGLLPLMLAFIGFIAYRPKSIMRFWIVIGLFALLLTFGHNTPLAKLMYHLPVYNKFRVPTRHFFEMSFAIAVLASFGIATIQRQNVTKGLILKTLLISAGVMSIGFIFVFFISDKLMIMAVKRGVGNIELLPWSNPAVGVPLIISLLAGISLFIWSRKSDSRFRQLFLLSVLIIDLGSFGWFYEWRDNTPRIKDMLPPPFVAQKYQRLLNDSNQRMIPIRGGLSFRLSPEIPPNISRAWGVPSASYYGPMILRRTSYLLDMAAHGAVSDEWASEENRVFDVMAIRYIFLPPGGMKQLQINGFNWARDNLHVALGSGCGRQHPDSVKFNFPTPLTATAIGIMSDMECSASVPNKAEVHVLVTDISGKVRTLNFYAGRTRSEIAVLPLDKTSKIKSIELQWMGPSGEIYIRKLSLLDEKTGQSYPVPSVESALSDNTHWRHVEDIGGTNIYENLSAMPRVWLVPEVVSLKIPWAILLAIKTSRMPDGSIYEPSRMALVEEPFTMKVSNFDREATAQIVRLNDTSIEVHTGSSSPAFMVLSDVYYPGWKATIDGAPTHLFQTNYLLRGVMVPSGGHVVRFEFKPTSFYIGAGISIVTLLFLLLGIVWVKIRFR